MAHAEFPLLKEFVAFIIEREAIRKKKDAGLPRPWTKDLILDTYRFCNVHREDDRVSRWIASEMRQPWVDEPDLWFAMVVARLLNLPESLAAVRGCILPFLPSQFERKLLTRKKLNQNNFNAAYIVSTNGIAMDKVEYLVERVLNPLWRDRKRLRPTINDTLEGWHLLLMTYDGLGSFMAAQVVADMKYAAPLNKAPDWWTFAASGPGSRRGLNRVMGVGPDVTWRRGAWEEALRNLARAVKFPLLKVKITLHNQDLQNCLCEFSKYIAMKHDDKPPKQLYKQEKK